MKRLHCELPQNIDHGNWVVLGPESKFSVGMTISYECNTGYAPFGKTKLVCLNSGYWSDNPPKCFEKGKCIEIKKCPYQVQPLEYNYQVLTFLKRRIKAPMVFLRFIMKKVLSITIDLSVAENCHTIIQYDETKSKTT